ncbi:hypothetical protein REPUB_Repub13aG0035700 [Reevesia pubescens]
MRIRVKINIHKPLKRVAKVVLSGQASLLVQLRYERMSDFCFVCSCLDPLESDCKWLLI